MSIFHALRVRVAQGTQFVADVRTAIPTGFRGRPEIKSTACGPDCEACVAACPTAAIKIDPVSIDLGRCVFCNECVAACPEAKIEFTAQPRMGGTSREDLVITAGAEERTRVRASEAFAKIFGRSLKLRQVSAGGCNGCELELGAIANVNFDIQRYGIEWVASPRHADGLVLSGTLTRTMRDAVRLAWDAMPEPRFLIAVGACAISGGLYDGASGVDRSFLDDVTPALYVPGCPAHPLTVVNAILDLLGVA
ncbi:MAG: hycG [Myxococcales bacterium]|nr:hycG [Myxococcales bacterium]